MRKCGFFCVAFLPHEQRVVHVAHRVHAGVHVHCTCLSLDSVQSISELYATCTCTGLLFVFWALGEVNVNVTSV